MSAKLCPKIILEGTRLTQKTEIAFALNEHPRIVDRFHISTQVYQQNAHGRSYDFGWWEQRLYALGFHLVLCVRSPESFGQGERKTIESLR